MLYSRFQGRHRRMRSVSLPVFGLLCVAIIEGCATSEQPTKGTTSESGFGVGGFGIGAAPSGSGGSDVGNGGSDVGSGGSEVGTGGQTPGTRGGTDAGGTSSGSGGSGGVDPITGGASGTGGAGCFLGICLATGGSGGGGVVIPPPPADAGTSHKAMCNQKLCVDPIFDCLLQGCGDAVCQIPFCVIK